jgi:hypothetical protein
MRISLQVKMVFTTGLNRKFLASDLGIDEEMIGALATLESL